MFGEWYQKTNKTEDTNKLTLFVASVLFVFWYHSPNVLGTPHICNISRLRVNTETFRNNININLHYLFVRWRSLLRQCATSRKIAGSITDGVIGIFHCHNPSGRTMALSLNQISRPPISSYCCRCSNVFLRHVPEGTADKAWGPSKGLMLFHSAPKGCAMAGLSSRSPVFDPSQSVWV
jgi:hypothetical protein